MVKAQDKINKTNNTKPAGSAVHLWFGENESWLAVEIDRWRTEFKKRQTGALCLTLEYEAKKADDLYNEIKGVCYSGGLFVNTKLLILKNFLSSEAKSDLAELLLKVASQPTDGLYLLFIEEGKISWSKNLAKRFKDLVDKGLVKTKDYASLSPAELEKWIVDKVRLEGGKISANTARLFGSLVGNDFLQLNNDIAKLLALRGSNEIRTNDLDSLVSVQLKDDVFAFVEAIGKRRIPEALEILKRQFDQGVAVQSLLGMTAWHFRVLMSVRQLMDKSGNRLSSREVAQELKLHPFVVAKTLQQLPYYSAKSLAELYEELHDLDIRLKTSRLEPEVLFSLFLSRLSNLQVH